LVQSNEEHPVEPIELEQIYDESEQYSLCLASASAKEALQPSSSGLERAKAMRNVCVILGEVGEVPVPGHITFATTVDARPLQKGIISAEYFVIMNGFFLLFMASIRQVLKGGSTRQTRHRLLILIPDSARIRKSFSNYPVS
jgi:hypothetical protein